MARTALGRVTAVFFVSVAAVLVAAFLFLAMEFSLIRQAAAQSMMTVQVMSCDGGQLTDPDPAMIEAGGHVFDFEEPETSAYVAATSQASRFVRDVSLRVAQFPDGRVIAVLHDDGEVCRILNVNPRLHRQALAALNGEPV